MRSLLAVPIVGTAVFVSFAHAQLSLDLELPKSTLVKRESLSFDLENTLQWGGTYRAKFKIGTPGQFISLSVPTRPSDILWVPASNSSTCEETTLENYGPCSFGGFDAESSSSFKSTKRSFHNDYGTNRTGAPMYANGVEFKDEIKLGDISLSNLTMGHADNVTNGIIPKVSLLYSDEYDAKDKSFIYQLWSQGHIPTLGYSVWLGSQTAKAGQLHLGGIDTSKYEGDLISFDTETFVLKLPLTSLSASSPTGTDELDSQLPISISLAMGTALSVLPQDLAWEIWAIAGVTTVTRGYLPLIPCSRRESEGIFTLEFGGERGVKINMTMKELVLDEGIYDPKLFPTDDEPLCVFGITNSTNWAGWLLGEAFFRSAYTAVDLDNKKIAIAPARIDADPDKSEVVAFNGNGAPIPSATQLSNQPTAAVEPTSEPSISDWSKTGKTYKAAEGFASLSTDDGSPSTSPSSGGGGIGLSTAAKAGIGVGAGLGAIIVMAGAFLVWRRGHRQGYKPTATSQEWTGKPELSGDGVGYDAAIKPHEIPAQSELTGEHPVSAVPQEVGGRERPAELCGGVNNT
ncbi:aspartic-type endopeptidase OPSB [Fusarium albosuccineum]|uniref:Aspartic-type endopeptidase OPSB n=1 Tax=Fusarium albosuccineum TaxID=1237068 RepID=A0A8H4PC55_9HYPO|nr:aspartic-type endopeptidase OPSB [Fusarium albosuccineum]